MEQPIEIVNKQNNPFYGNNHDILTQKKVLNKDITREHVEKNPAGFANFIANEATGTTNEEPLIYNIITKKEQASLTESLKRSLLTAPIPSNITIRIDNQDLKLTPVYTSVQSNTPEQNKVHKVKLENLFNFYREKQAEKDFEIIALSLEEQIDTLSKANSFQIANTELVEWQKTLKTLLNNAKGGEEINQVQKYVEKTQAIIRVLNQTYSTPDEKQSAVESAVSEFNETIKSLSEKDKIFATGLMFSAAVIAIVVMLGIAISIALNPLTLLPFICLFLTIPASAGAIGLVEKYVKHEINEADSPGVISRALSQLGIFNYTPYKKTASVFSDTLEKEFKTNNYQATQFRD